MFIYHGGGGGIFLFKINNKKKEFLCVNFLLNMKFSYFLCRHTATSRTATMVANDQRRPEGKPRPRWSRRICTRSRRARRF